ncbi:hypothetical protein FOPE_10903 [Fonsecaea pedrosoi]|nr:hypothetical protein FOPE_10903 [Fonsecaea pedrosoi]
MYMYIHISFHQPTGSGTDGQGVLNGDTNRIPNADQDERHGHREAERDAQDKPGVGQDQHLINPEYKDCFKHFWGPTPLDGLDRIMTRGNTRTGNVGRCSN